MTTFLGVPIRRSSADQSPLRGDRTFPQAAKDAVADPVLRRNLGRATATIRDKRAAMVAEVDDWEALRDTASAVKADVMARLPELLVQLEEQVTARGGIVHWAADAAEANQIVADLVEATGAGEVVKVKSMATQEIGLNEYLEERGIAAIETDLAELIVQLGHDKPSHILVPAIHRGRAEIRQIFLDQMDGVTVGLGDEPKMPAEAARTHLRRKFLSAKVAISGANFAIADTGTLAVVESEGNGRMCLTLPDTLITVMGIEKLLPTFADLEVFLQILPRSSTGERMNPYTSLDRCDPRRRSAKLSPHPARQRPHQRPGRRSRSGRVALHPLLRLPERLPGLRTGRRARLRFGVSGPDRRHFVPAIDRGGGQRVVAVRLLAVRGLL